MPQVSNTDGLEELKNSSLSLSSSLLCLFVFLFFSSLTQLVEAGCPTVLGLLKVSYQEGIFPCLRRLVLAHVGFRWGSETILLWFDVT